MSFPSRTSLPEPTANRTPDNGCRMACSRRSVFAGIQPDPNAMVLATADAHGAPSARVVLCKEIEPRDGYIPTILQQLSVAQGHGFVLEPACCHRDALGHDAPAGSHGRSGRSPVPLRAKVMPISPARAWQSRIGAWASQQSSPIASRSNLLPACRGAHGAALRRALTRQQR